LRYHGGFDFSEEPPITRFNSELALRNLLNHPQYDSALSRRENCPDVGRTTSLSAYLREMDEAITQAALVNVYVTVWNQEIDVKKP
jgi:hypothetical protein